MPMEHESDLTNTLNTPFPNEVPFYVLEDEEDEDIISLVSSKFWS